jgi:nucleoside-diphosphate-sugar epimerase
VNDKHVLILGCGYTGVALAQRLAFKGQPVVGTTRTEARASIIRTRGAHPIVWDGREVQALAPWRGRVHAVVCSIPPDVAPNGDFTDLTAALLDFFADWSLDAFVYISSTSVYGDRGGEVADEDTPCDPDSPRGAARLAIERQVLAAPLTGMVIRPAGIYGPGRSQLHRMAAAKYRLVGGGGAFTNRVHVTDLAALIEAAINRGQRGAVYLGSDLEPATQRAVVDHVVTTYGLSVPTDMPLAEARIRLDKNVLAMVTGSKRLDPAKTLAALGVKLRFPSYREGLADVWRRQRSEIEALVPR